MGEWDFRRALVTCKRGHQFASKRGEVSQVYIVSVLEQFVMMHLRFSISPPTEDYASRSGKPVNSVKFQMDCRVA